MSFSGNLVSFGFEDDVIIYDKLVEVIDNVVLGLLQSQKPKQNPNRLILKKILKL